MKNSVTMLQSAATWPTTRISNKRRPFGTAQEGRSKAEASSPIDRRYLHEFCSRGGSSIILEAGTACSQAQNLVLRDIDVVTHPFAGERRITILNRFDNAAMLAHRQLAVVTQIN